VISSGGLPFSKNLIFLSQEANHQPLHTTALPATASQKLPLQSDIGNDAPEMFLQVSSIARPLPADLYTSVSGGYCVTEMTDRLMIK